MGLMNRLGNAKNKHQGSFKRVLCVCSAGVLRSPTAALVLSSEPFNYNTRAAGIDPDFALIPVDPVLIEWADEIVCMEMFQAMALETMTEKPIYCLDIEDDFEYRDQKLMALIAEQYNSRKPFGELAS